MNEKERAAELLREIKRRKRARESFADYLEYVDGRPLPRHVRYICEQLQAVADGATKRLMVSLPPGHGKALALDTPIATPDGWKTMGELQVGDYVFDEKGRPTRVIGVSPVFKNRPTNGLCVVAVSAMCGKFTRQKICIASRLPASAQLRL